MLEEFSFDKVNSAVVVSLKLPATTSIEVSSSLKELEFLAKTLGINVIESFTQSKPNVEPNYFIGKGKLNEIKEFIKNNEVDAVLFDNELTGIQERNLEKYLDKIIFGRTELILNIFYKRAATKEAKLQVQLACLEYLKPRLKNRWDHFSRVEGGIGMRGGEGEKQLELDRRMIDNQIHLVKNKLKRVDVQMSNRRKKRSSANIVSLVGYTNAGKSTLFNQFSKAGVLSENMLFSTLDPTIRRVYINDNLTILLSDTIGFINKLPHSLVASFKSTLEEIVQSRLILHVIDASSPNVINNIRCVNETLKEIEAHNIPCIRIFNKVDLLPNGASDCIVPKEHSDLFISALNNRGIDKLKEKISKNLLPLN